MKRDMDLIRKIAIAIEDDTLSECFTPEINDQICYHIQLMIEAGLVVGKTMKSDGDLHPRIAMVERLTWSGHDFTDSIRSDSVWGQTKGIISNVGFASFEIWRSVVSSVLMNNLGLGE